MVNKVEEIERTKKWIANFVIGLTICPFASHPFERGLIDYQVYDGMDLEECLTWVSKSILQLDETPAEKVETVLLIIPGMLARFEDYLDFLDTANALLVDLKLEGIIQIASFHPQYQFAGTHAEDISNYTNRSPYPMLHLLREDSVYEATQNHPDVESIPDRNIRLLESMDPVEIKSYLK